MGKREMATVECGYCGGSGRRSLTGALVETLTLLHRQQHEISGANLARLADCSGEAMANRLVVLERYGLAKGRRNGRERLWKATDPVGPGA
jgi:hypothetical protein